MEYHFNTLLFLESMILLGSIERTELLAVFDWWLSPERRVFERGQNSPSHGLKVSWESFTFVDEEGGGEENTDKVKKAIHKFPPRCVFTDSAVHYVWLFITQ